MKLVFLALAAMCLSCEGGGAAATVGDVVGGDVAEGDAVTEGDATAGSDSTDGAPQGPSGEQLWNENCVSCHKADGSGTAAGPDLRPRVPLLDDQKLRDTITGRKRDNGTPIFGHLSERDLDLLIEYLREAFG